MSSLSLSSLSPFTSKYSFLEDSGIKIQTKSESPHLVTSESRKPPKVQGKRTGNSARSSRPKSLLGPDAQQTALAFPSRHYDAHDRNWTYLYQCFDVLEQIGQGGYAVVFKVRSKDDGQLYAVKKSREEIPRNGLKRDQAIREVRYQHRLSNHPNILKLYQAWEENGIVYMQLELCEQSLLDVSMSQHYVEERMLRKILIEACSAIKYIHDNNCIHLDIKTANIMLTSDGVCKLGDFGLISNLSHNPSDFDEGDPKYLASEVLSGRYTKAADIFSLGISILELACDLILPGNGEAWHELRSPKFPKTLPTKVSAQMVAIILSMMDHDYTSRPTAQQIIDELSKPRKMFELVTEEATSIVSSFYSPFRVLFTSGYDAVIAKLRAFWNALRRIFFGEQELMEVNHNSLTSSQQNGTPIRRTNRKLQFTTSDDDSN